MYKKYFPNNKGFVLVIGFLVIVVLAGLAAAMISRLITESMASARYKESVQAFYLAEAAIDRAIAKLPSNTNDEAIVGFGPGQYCR